MDIRGREGRVDLGDCGQVVYKINWIVELPMHQQVYQYLPSALPGMQIILVHHTCAQRWISTKKTKKKQRQATASKKFTARHSPLLKVITPYPPPASASGGTPEFCNSHDLYRPNAKMMN